MPWGSRYVLRYFPDPIPWPGDGIQTINPVRVWILGDVCIYYNYIYIYMHPKNQPGSQVTAALEIPERTLRKKKKQGQTNPSFLEGHQWFLGYYIIFVIIHSNSKSQLLHFEYKLILNHQPGQMGHWLKRLLDDCQLLIQMFWVSHQRKQRGVHYWAYYCIRISLW